jgi:hypothetical protein
MKTLTLAMFLFLSIASAQAAPVSFREIHHEGSSGLAFDGLIRVDTSGAWKQLWDEVRNKIFFPATEPPAVDFRTELVIAFQDTGKPSGAFDSVITGIEDLGDVIEVRVEQREPGKNCFVTADIGNPISIVAIPLASGKAGLGWWQLKPLRVSISKKIHDCH